MNAATRKIAWTYARRWPCVLSTALIAASALLSTRSFGPDRAGPSPLSALLLLTALAWAGLDLGAHVRRHGIWPGSRLVPGLHKRLLQFTMSWSASLIALCAIVAWVSGQSVLSLLSLGAFVLTLSLWPGLIFATNERAAMLGFVLAMGFALNLVIFVSASRGSSPFVWPAFLPVPIQQGGLLLLAGFLLWGLGLRVRNRGEDALEYRLSAASREAGGESAAGKAIKYAFLGMMPPIARRSVRLLPTSATRSAWGRAQLWRQASGPLRPAGLALIFVPFIGLITWMGMQDYEGVGLHTNPILFLANGLIILLAYYDRDRMAAELLRPAGRKDLARELGRALLLDVAEFWTVLTVLHVAVHALMVPAFLREPLYWGPYLLSPGALLFEIGAAGLFARLAKPWMGFMAFLLTWILAFILSLSLQERSLSAPWIWALFSAVMGIQILWMAPLGLRQLARMEARPARRCS